MQVTSSYMVGQDAVQMYANLVGDDNPLHTDQSYGDRDETFGDGTIVHGTLVQGWFSAQLNNIGEQFDAEVIIVDLFTEFHNPVPVGEVVQVSAHIDDDDCPSDEQPQVISEVGLRATAAYDEAPTEYASGTATLMIDQTVPRSDGT